MEGDGHKVVLACVISGSLFSVLGSASFFILWAVNWRPWRIYSYFSNHGADHMGVLADCNIGPRHNWACCGDGWHCSSTGILFNYAMVENTMAKLKSSNYLKLADLLWEGVDEGKGKGSQLIRGGKRDIFMGRPLGGERPLCGLFPCLYHLSSLKNHFMADFLVWNGNSCSFSFGFRRALSDRETSNVVALISLLESHSFRLGRRDVTVWSPFPLEGFLCKSFFQCLVNSTPTSESVSSLIWRIKVPRKFVLFSWQVEEDLDHLLWHCELVSCVWDDFLQTFGLSYARHRDVRGTVEEFLLNSPCGERGPFLWHACVHAHLVGFVG
ncbi:calpain-type cysteine protease DEK1 [Cucumis melo var. makuwa]|uniref:Calpain-type cysteine protease DEK1 n=1 Tax=Cucumis melo var. makuwa TaxID=1194695 RepID=A0A5D3CI74_CUCMM|nr:calpain-type cysteine protease DEK1 [Cucumis melo var. makuwa]